MSGRVIINRPLYRDCDVRTMVSKFHRFRQPRFQNFAGFKVSKLHGFFEGVMLRDFSPEASRVHYRDS